MKKSVNKTLAGISLPAVLLFSAMIFASCSHRDELTVTVSNPSKADHVSEMVELSASDLLDRLDADYCYVADSHGKEIPSQITYDGLLIFPVELKAGEIVEYEILKSDSLHTYSPVATGRIYPERADDVAWENENGGFRIYGPATQTKGERAFGYDLFLKHPTPEPIVEKLYEPETNPRTWEIVDSLRAISNVLAEEYIHSFSYHVDHGLGFDPYAVGPTLGAGVAVPVVADTLSFAWCYEKAEVLDNGPLRFTVRLDFAPRRIGDDSNVAEHRIISLDAGGHLNKTKVWYTGMTKAPLMAAGFPLRDDSIPAKGKKYIAYSDPTQGTENGRALVGVVLDDAPDSIGYRQNHYLVYKSLKTPADTLNYHWGFAWSRAGIPDIRSWQKYLDAFTVTKENPIMIKVN